MSGLFGGGGGDSSTQANQTSTYNDSRSVLGQDAAWGSTVVRDSNNTSNTAFTTSNSGNTSTTNDTAFTTSNSGNTSTTNDTAFTTSNSGNTTSMVDNTHTNSTAFTTANSGNTSTSTDTRTVVDSSLHGNNSGNSSNSTTTSTIFNALDGGSIASAFGFADRLQQQAWAAQTTSLGGALSIVDHALSAGQQQTAQSLSGLQTAYADAKGQGAQTSKMIMLAIGGALLVALMASRKTA